MRGNSGAVLFLAWALLAPLSIVAQAAKDLITLDEFMNATDVKEVKLSPDGSAAIIATEAPDWQHNRFRQRSVDMEAEDGRDGPLNPLRACACSAVVS